MSLKSEKRMSMDELMELNQASEDPTNEIMLTEMYENLGARLMEVLELEGMILEQIRRTKNALNTLATVEDLQTFMEELAEIAEQKNQSLAQEWEKKLEELKQDGRARERHIENIESRISRNIEELTEGINNLCGKAVLIVLGAILAAVLVSVCFLWLR